MYKKLSHRELIARQRQQSSVALLLHFKWFAKDEITLKVSGCHRKSHYSIGHISFITARAMPARSRES